MEAQTMNHLKGFNRLLSQELDALTKLVKLEDEKYEVLKQVELKNLMNINANEEEILRELETIEKKRKDMLIVLSREFHFDPNLSLSELSTHLFGDEFGDIKKQLILLREEIKSKTEKLQITMQENSQMIHTNLEIINLTMGFANRNSQKEIYDYRNKKDNKENIYLFNQIA